MLKACSVLTGAKGLLCRSQGDGSSPSGVSHQRQTSFGGALLPSPETKLTRLSTKLCGEQRRGQAQRRALRSSSSKVVPEGATVRHPGSWPRREEALGIKGKRTLKRRDFRSAPVTSVKKTEKLQNELEGQQIPLLAVKV